MHIKCPWCGQKYDIEESMIGAEAQCQSCGKNFSINEEDIYDRNDVKITQIDQDNDDSAAFPPEQSSYIEETKTKLKPLTCEMCGSTNLLKQDGVFVCQSCGTKYSVEEARKMMASGTINVEGTVKVDNSAFVEKYLSNARRALSKDDWEEVEKYYNMVEQNSPNNMEAVFFSSFGKTMLSLTEDEYFKREQKFNVLNNSISVINDYYEVTKEDKEKVLRQISDAIQKMFTTTFVYNPSAFGGTGSKSWNVDLMNSVRSAFLTELRQIQEVHKDEAFIQELIDKHSKPISAGCYIATAVYGSYDCPQVWTLRRYRDDTLATRWFGRCFIHIYYAISPTLVRWFGKNKLFINSWKRILDWKVQQLNKAGVSNLPYEDQK